MDLPLECLADEENHLLQLEQDKTDLPQWITKEEALDQVKASINNLKEHIAKYGNTWEIL